MVIIFIFKRTKKIIDFFVGMANRSKLPTERYKYKDFLQDEIKQRLNNVVSTILILPTY
jgi:hypothetical protein